MVVLRESALQALDEIAAADLLEQLFVTAVRGGAGGGMGGEGRCDFCLISLW